MDRAAERLALEKLRVVFDLHDAGIALMRQNLRRRFPSASDAEIEARVATWLHDRPCDAEGAIVPWPRPPS